MQAGLPADPRGARKARTRAGCLNCKSKRRKCDESKPVCRRCIVKGESCEWGTRFVFRAENALGVDTVQPPLQQRRPLRFEIKDVTAEVIRDYYHEPEDDATPSTAAPRGVPFHFSPDWQREVASHSPMSTLARSNPNEVESRCSDLSPPDDLGYIWPSPTNGLFDDSIFLPGSAYLDAHSTLRSHLIHEVRSSAPTRPASPDPPSGEHVWPAGGGFHEAENGTHSSPLGLSDEDEFLLWKNWLDEVAPWLDKFDSERHFQHTLPIMARSHDHLRYSILAVSARQLERKQRSQHTERSLALYQMAIHLVLPQLHTRSTAVIASCVVLCVLEMLSSAPKAWRQHLDGCAHLIEAVGINGFAGGLDQALFWCFARMDVCGGLIASMKTLIPVDRWALGDSLDADILRFRERRGFDAHACHAVYLCAQVLDLLAVRPHVAERVGASPHVPQDVHGAYTARWIQLWRYIEAWHAGRPEEMLPISSISSTSSPFPMVLYSNPAAISGNQLYHTASILMLQHRPLSTAVVPKPRSIFWHARQICAISMSNSHHGAWTNSIQPLWIAGQWMSHSSEQKAILELLERIERETGWGTKWRAEDLKEFWG